MQVALYYLLVFLAVNSDIYSWGKGMCFIYYMYVVCVHVCVGGGRSSYAGSGELGLRDIIHFSVHSTYWNNSDLLIGPASNE